MLETNSGPHCTYTTLGTLSLHQDGMKTYMLVGFCTRHAVQLIPRQICVMAAVDEVVRDWVTEIYGRRGVGRVRGGRFDVLEELVIERRLCKLR